MVHTNDIKPYIVVIIATKNKHELLEKRSLKSVFAQTLQPDSIIVVDDSSSQNSIDKDIEIINKYNKQLHIEHIINHRTPGTAGSWNSAIDFLLLHNHSPENTFIHSPENTFIAILDEDDEWCPDYLNLCTESILQNSLDMIACDSQRIIGEKKELNTAPNGLFLNDFLVENLGIQSLNIFIRLSCFLEAGGFDENMQSCLNRDLYVRITDLGIVNYKRLATPLINNFGENDRIKMNVPYTETLNIGLYNFWLKHSKRMSTEQKEKYLQKAKELFNWELLKIVKDKKVANLKEKGVYGHFNLFVGIICSDYNVISPLLTQLVQLQNEEFIDQIKVFLLENNLSVNDKNKINKQINSLEIIFITKKIQDKWISTIDYFKHFKRNENAKFSIAQARTLLQKYVGQMMENSDSEVISWILDEDMEITSNTIEGLKLLPTLKKHGHDIVLGKIEFSSPNPPLNGIRVQLVDILHNLNWLINQNSKEILQSFSKENNHLMEIYPDYYYDLSRKHYGHLEHPFWLLPISNDESIESALNRLCKNAIQIFGGYPITRPLKTLNSKNILNSVQESVNRGGTTFIFNSKALTDTPNLSLKINGSDIRRSDMIWAIINKYYKKMDIVSVNIPILHRCNIIKETINLNIDKIKEEILGSCLYAGIMEFLNKNPKHNLNFEPDEISEIIKKINKHLTQRMILLNQSFYRNRGIAKSIKNLDIYKQNEYIKNFIKTVESIFNQKNYELIKGQINSISNLSLSNFLDSIQVESNNFKNITNLWM